MSKHRRPVSDDDSDDDTDTIHHLFKSQLKPDSEILPILEALKATSINSGSTSETLTLTDLNLSSTCSGGLVIGRLIYSENGDIIDCAKMGTTGKDIPRNLDIVCDMSSDALFILLVEEDGAYMRLAFDSFYERFPCIIVAVKGQRDVATRQFLRKMKRDLKLPVLALVDSDLNGLKILKNMSNDSGNLTTLDIKWLGVRPSDLDKYKIPKNCRLPMTEKDIKTVKDLLKEDFVKKNPGWVEELNLMVKTKHNVEIQAFCAFGFRYLSEVYLPLKLQEQDWL